MHNAHCLPIGSYGNVAEIFSYLYTVCSNHLKGQCSEIFDSFFLQKSLSGPFRKNRLNGFANFFRSGEDICELACQRMGVIWGHRIIDDRIEKYGSLFVFISK